MDVKKKEEKMTNQEKHNYLVRQLESYTFDVDYYADRIKNAHIILRALRNQADDEWTESENDDYKLLVSQIEDAEKNLERYMEDFEKAQLNADALRIFIDWRFNHLPSETTDINR